MIPQFTLALAILNVLLQGTALAQTPPTPLVISSSFSTNFTALQCGAEGTVLPFENGVTLGEGFWANMDSYVTSYGGSNVGALYSFCQTGDTDGALGSETSNKHKTVSFGISLNLTNTVKEIQINYTGKQFRWGGDNLSNILGFDYSSMTAQKYESGGWGGLPNPPPAGWVTVSELSFISPINGSSNAPIGPVFATQSLSATITGPFPAGNVVQLRWTAHDQKDGLAIDDLTITFIYDSPSSSTTSPPPTVSPTPRKSSVDDFWKKFALSGWGLFGFVIIFALALIGACAYYRRRQMRSNEEHQPLHNHDNSNWGA